MSIYDVLADLSPVAGCRPSGQTDSIEAVEVEAVEVDSRVQIAEEIDALKLAVNVVAAVDYLGRVWVLRDGVDPTVSTVRVVVIDGPLPVDGYEALADQVAERVASLASGDGEVDDET